MKLEVLTNQSSQRDYPPLLFVHGSMHGAWCWSNFMDYFAEQGIACKAMSLRGHGSSEGKNRLHTWCLSDYVEDVAQVVNEFERPPIIIGHSLGGMVLQKYLAKYSSTDIQAVVLLSCSAFSLYKTVLRIIRFSTPGFFKILFSKNIKNLAMMADIASFKKAFFSKECQNVQIAQHFKDIQGESILAIMGLIFYKAINPKSITVPISVMVGSEDKVEKPMEAQKSALYLNADFNVVQGNAHDLMLDNQWQESAHAIMNWIMIIMGENK